VVKEAEKKLKYKIQYTILRQQGRNVPIACYYTAPRGTHDEAVIEEHGDSVTKHSFAQ
jgi:hypothetical protein